MAEPPPFPWVYAYQEDGPRLDLITLRPVVPIRIVGRDVSETTYALVDSGSTHILAAPWLADAAGVDRKASGRRLRLGIGGATVDVEFADVSLRLMAPVDDDECFIEWQAEVGFVQHWRATWPVVVGQIGFLDQFTVTPSLYAKHTAIESNIAFDERYPTPLA